MYTHMHTYTQAHANRLVVICYIDFTTTDRLSFAVANHCPEAWLLTLRPVQCPTDS